ncbi:MAG: hypothetical protein Q8Q49_06635 [bacterium]|nr:hypothetical protein [bacterium]
MDESAPQGGLEAAEAEGRKRALEFLQSLDGDQLTVEQLQEKVTEHNGSRQPDPTKNSGPSLWRMSCTNGTVTVHLNSGALVLQPGLPSETEGPAHRIGGERRSVHAKVQAVADPFFEERREANDFLSELKRAAARISMREAYDQIMQHNGPRTSAAGANIGDQVAEIQCSDGVLRIHFAEGTLVVIPKDVRDIAKLAD